MGLIRIVFGDPKCTVHGQPVPEGQTCPKCVRDINPTTRRQPKRAPKPKPGHAPYPCPVPGCRGTVRQNICPLSDLHP